MSRIIATVLKTGGIYDRRHVRWLWEQFPSEVRLTVYTDDSELLSTMGELARPLRHNLPGWWSKMELFDPSYPDDIVFFDLDTVIRRDGPAVLKAPFNRPLILRDFYRPHGLQSSVMCIPHEFKAEIWRQWLKSPCEWMNLFDKDGLGDQAFLEAAIYSSWGILQDQYPGEYLSWKADDLEGRTLPSAAKVIVFHGRPKPWDIPHAEQIWRD